METFFYILGLIIGAITIIVLIIPIYIYLCFSWGLILYKLWYWFLLPAFPNLIEINYPHAIGLFILISLFNVMNINTNNINSIIIKNNNEISNELIDKVCILLLLPWLFLLATYLLKIFMNIIW